MVRYYFDIRDGEDFTEDDEGMELRGIADAQLEAAAAFAQICKDFHVKDSNPLGYPLSAGLPTIPVEGHQYLSLWKSV